MSVGVASLERFLQQWKVTLDGKGEVVASLK